MEKGVTGKKNFTREEMLVKALVLWERYGERYRNLVPKYEKLLARKRELKIRPLNAVAQSVIAEIPEIEFLNIQNKKAARKFVKRMKVSELSMAILETEMMIDGYAFNTIEAHNYDFEYEIRHHGDKKGRMQSGGDWMISGAVSKCKRVCNEPN